MGKYRDKAEAHMRDVCCDEAHIEEHCDSFEEGAEFAEKRIYDLLEAAPQMDGKRPTLWQELKAWLEKQPVETD